MVSLWGSNQSGDGDDTASTITATHNGHNETAPRESHEADERAPLISRERRPPPNADGYLDPDDPAVSPYNLWSVRLTHHFTVLFLVLTFVWWVLLLVSIFVTPPGLNTRGSGFFDFAYTTLTSWVLLLTLLFFTAPSRAMRVLLGIVTLLLFTEMLMIVIVPRLRLEESWPGIASIVWAVIMSAWCIVADRIVAYGKKEEEERLTGRAETRRTVKEWVSVLVATIILSIYVVIAVLFTATLVLRARDSSLEAPGQRIPVDGGKYHVHLACYNGNGVTNVTIDAATKKLPTVLIEAGHLPAEYELVPFAIDAYNNGSIGRFCYWDRPGYGWSDNAPSPHSADTTATILSQALALAGEQGPWVLASAGYGSVVSRIFASRHQNDVKALLLVDPYHENLLYRLAKPGNGIMLWAYGIVSPLGIQRILGALFSGRTREDRVYGRHSYQGGKFIKAQLQVNLVADSLTKTALTTSRDIQRKDTPFALISSGSHSKLDPDWERSQRDLTHLTDKLISWDVVSKAPHEVWRTYEGRDVIEKRLAELVRL